MKTTEFVEMLATSWIPIVRSAAVLIGAVALGLIVAFVLLFILRSLRKGTGRYVYQALREKIRAPVRILMPLIALAVLIGTAELSENALEASRQILEILIILAVTWLFVKLVLVIEALLLAQFELREKDNLTARKVHTQVRLFKRMMIIGISLIGTAIILLNFDQVRELGTTILASAGILGIVLGFAAQKTLGNLIAGIQIAITQPIKIDDVVIVENEWGRIEEITLTYVVVKIWDLRRLVLPITYFVENPFQNWTRETSDILGTVFVYTDFRIPVQEIREELTRMVGGNPLWDGQVCTLQVTNLTDRTVELRALVSARNSSDAWYLRCEVRENLLGFIQENYPESLPRFRAELEGAPAGNTG
jgi:small-conductance mechanosensitive channel